MVEQQPSKLNTRVQFPSPAPTQQREYNYNSTCCIKRQSVKCPEKVLRSFFLRALIGRYLRAHLFLRFSNFNCTVPADAQEKSFAHRRHQSARPCVKSGDVNAPASTDCVAVDVLNCVSKFTHATEGSSFSSGCSSHGYMRELRDDITKRFGA